MAMRLERSGVPGGIGCRTREVLSPAVEIRRADLEKDAEAIAGLFDYAAEHLAGVAPRNTGGRNIAKFRGDIAKYVPTTPTITEEALVRIARGIIVATPEEIKAYYKKAENSELYVAVIGGKTVGTVTLEMPSGSGMRWGSISKLVVTKDAPKAGGSKDGKGIGRKLVQFATNRLFNELSCTAVTAGIIQDVEGSKVPEHLFRTEGYPVEGELSEICLGWDKTTRQFVSRNSFRVKKSASHSKAS